MSFSPALFFPLIPQCYMKQGWGGCACSPQRGGIESKGEDSDTHLSVLNPVKISKENCVFLGNSVAVHIRE